MHTYICIHILYAIHRRSLSQTNFYICNKFRLMYFVSDSGRLLQLKRNLVSLQCVRKIFLAHYFFLVFSVCSFQWRWKRISEIRRFCATNVHFKTSTLTQMWFVDHDFTYNSLFSWRFPFGAASRCLFRRLLRDLLIGTERGSGRRQKGSANWTLVSLLS